MRTFSKLKGLPIYSNQSAELLGYVSDLCFSHEGYVIGLKMDGKGIFKRDRFAPIEAIQAIGEHGVMISAVESLLSFQDLKTHYCYQTYEHLRFKAVLTAQGERLGLLDDVYFSEKMGTIEAYELTNGFFADLTEGKKVIKASGQPLTISKDAIVMDFRL
ncbi:PRC-barrel domain-containing protein [Metabacillus herbersteinensis]|uniref:PRC-barrel domain-containing protein n=1 Tax=Metabacillus herbersteinensis TaxID=283816 RepID=A0ABV6G8V0_9BACI